jgi:hypothetical protein
LYCIVREDSGKLFCNLSVRHDSFIAVVFDTVYRGPCGADALAEKKRENGEDTDDSYNE